MASAVGSICRAQRGGNHSDDVLRLSLLISLSKVSGSWHEFNTIGMRAPSLERENTPKLFRFVWINTGDETRVRLGVPWCARPNLNRRPSSFQVFFVVCVWVGLLVRASRFEPS
jgi:hypothetical protein